MDISAKNRWLLFLIFTVNFLALTFQVVWVREIMNVFGSSALSVSVVLSVFLGGIALGAYVGSNFFSSLENKYKASGSALIILGVYCLFLPLIFDVLHYPFLFVRSFVADPFTVNIIKFFISSLILVVPTTIIGAMFPFIVGLYTEGMERAEEGAAYVYVFDTLGATLGALFCGFIFVPHLGLTETTVLAASVFILIGLFFLKSNLDVKVSEDSEAKKFISMAAPISKRQFSLLVVLFLTGLIAIGLEVVWIRLFNLVFGSSNYAFTLVVASFLLGLSLGSFLIKKFMRFIVNKELVFSYLVVAIGVFSLFVVLSYDGLERFYFMVYDVSNNFYFFQSMLFVVSFIVMLVPTTLMGANFPLAIAIYSSNNETMGQDAGKVFAWNTAGGIVGSFAAGFLIIPKLGLWGTSSLFFVVYIFIAVYLFVFFVKNYKNHLASVLLVSVLIFFVFLIKPNEPKTVGAMYYHGIRAKDFDNFKSTKDNYDSMFYKQGFYGLVSIDKNASGDLILRNNGKTDASTGKPDMLTQYMLGYLGVLLKDGGNVKNVLNIGLGGGFTVGSLSHFSSVEKIDSVEIDPLVVEAVTKHFYPYNDNVMNDKRVVSHIEDGRHFLDTTNNKYDIIISEPPNIWVSGVSRLFTSEFYKSASERLNDDGILVQWLPPYELSRDDIDMALNTVRERFKYVRYWSVFKGSDIIVLASHRELEPDFEYILKTIEDAGLVDKVQRFYPMATKKILWDFANDYIEIDPTPDFFKVKREVNTDNLPHLEFNSIKSKYYINKEYLKDTFDK